MNNSYENTAIGLSALGSATSPRNTAIGASALMNLTTGSGNTTLGYRAGSNLTTGSNNIIIGNNINAPNAIRSNQLNIGNFLYGSGVGITGNSMFSIGSSTPASVFEVWSGTTVYTHSRGAGNIGLGYGAVRTATT